MYHRPAPDADGVVTAWLHGAAARHAGWTAPAGEARERAIAELRDIAGDRADLLAKVAGIMIGAAPADYPGHHRIAARLLIEAGADLTQVEPWIHEGVMRTRPAGELFGGPLTCTAEQARPLLSPAHGGTRERGDRPPCVVCRVPADTVVHSMVGNTITTLPCGHRVTIEDAAPGEPRAPGH